MDTAYRIQSLVDSIGRVAEMHQDCTSAAGFACRAITASAGRAVLSEKRLSSAARMSVASSAMAFVANVMDSATPPFADVILADIVREASRLAPLSAPEHEADGSSQSPPAGWSGPDEGPYTRDSIDGARLTVSRRPHLPGGDWTFHYGGVPASFGDCPAAAAARGELFDALFVPVTGGPRRPPPLSVSRLRTKNPIS